MNHTTDNHARTRVSCYIASGTLAVICNLAPLFFMVFSDTFRISTGRLTFLVTFNFIAQLVADLLFLPITHKIGLRRSAVLANVLCSMGLTAFACLPLVCPAYPALLMSVVIYSFGVGLLEASSNTICDAIPKNAPSAGLVFLHSFYCWGQMLTVLLTTLGLWLLGNSFWWILPLLWALLPLINGIRFARVPWDEEVAGGGLGVRALLPRKGFCLCLGMIVCGCAAEHAMCQWASYFAEHGLGVSKVAGDLLGICLFAVMLGLARILYATVGRRISEKASLIASAIGCFACYLGASLITVPWISLLFCALTGFFVSLMCPNSLNLANRTFGGGRASFVLMLTFADLGCAIGPTLTGKITGAFEKSALAGRIAAATGLSQASVGMRGGILMSGVFPIALLILLFLFHGAKAKAPQTKEKEETAAPV